MLCLISVKNLLLKTGSCHDLWLNNRILFDSINVVDDLQAVLLLLLLFRDEAVALRLGHLRRNGGRDVEPLGPAHLVEADLVVTVALPIDLDLPRGLVEGLRGDAVQLVRQPWDEGEERCISKGDGLRGCVFLFLICLSNPTTT